MRDTRKAKSVNTNSKAFRPCRWECDSWINLHFNRWWWAKVSRDVIYCQLLLAAQYSDCFLTTCVEHLEHNKALSCLWRWNGCHLTVIKGDHKVRFELCYCIYPLVCACLANLPVIWAVTINRCSFCDNFFFKLVKNMTHWALLKLMTIIHFLQLLLFTINYLPHCHHLIIYHSYVSGDTVNVHKQSTNHISQRKGLDVMQSHSLHRTHFSQYQASSAGVTRRW